MTSSEAIANVWDRYRYIYGRHGPQRAADVALSDVEDWERTGIMDDDDARRLRSQIENLPGFQEVLMGVIKFREPIRVSYIMLTDREGEPEATIETGIHGGYVVCVRGRTMQDLARAAPRLLEVDRRIQAGTYALPTDGEIRQLNVLQE